MKRLYRFSLMLLALMLPATAFAHNFEVDGIYYNFNGNGVTVTYKGSSFSQYSDEYYGDVIIPDTVTYNGVTYPVSSIGEYAFYSCSSMSSVVIPNSVTYIGKWAFEFCDGITSIEIPASVTSIVVNPFDGCYNLNYIHVQSGNPKYDSRNNCNAIIETNSNTLITGCKNTIIPYGITSIGEDSFSGCKNMTSISIPNSVTSIGRWAFGVCTSLKSIEIPNSVLSIGEAAFIECSTLKEVVIPNSVISIGDAAFKYCYALRRVEISNSVVTIGSNVFNKCNYLSNILIAGEGEWHSCSLSSATNSSLKLFINSQITSVKGMQLKPSHIYCYSMTPPECDEISFTSYSGTLHVPATSLAAYFTAPFWSNFTNIIGDAVEPNITINQNSIEVQLNNQYLLSAIISPTDAYPQNVTWRTTNPAVATVNDGTITAVGIGECDIVAKCLFKEAICHVVVINSNTTIYLDQDQASVLPNHIIVLNPSSSSDDLPNLVVTSSDPSVAAARVVNNKIQVVGIKEGTTTITVGSVDGTAIPATCLVTVYTEPSDINCDGFVNISDVTDLIDYLLSGDSSQISTKNADVDGDGNINISDVTELIDILLQGT